ncbi:MAG: nitrilase-related carbon-nitrogen hydrolase [Microbacterium sp.]|uniref:nitrilase-related carbon-nitrogen hydrolase n=1 Tax=Microbacterium sp. TaxID=51671 RepID=UPI0039E35140
MTAKTVRIRCTQLSPRIGAVADNLTRIDSELAQAAADAVDLLVLPELATCGYAMTAEEARAAALPADGEVLRGWAESLAGTTTTAVIGFCEDGGDVLYNSAAVVAAGAEPVVYRKLHLWDTEKLLFSAGGQRPPIVRTPAGALGVMICYDLEFPELPRSLALEGAEMIAVPTNWPSRARPGGEHPHEIVHAMAAAQASALAIACCDRAGDERGLSWTEGTAVVGPDGWPIGELDADSRLDVEVELPAARTKTSGRNDLFGDRRPEFYGPLGTQ